MRHCTKCNRKYQDKSIEFCLEDGFPVIDREAPTKVLIRNPPIVQAAESPKRKHFRIILAAVGLLVLLVGVFAIIIIGRSKTIPRGVWSGESITEDRGVLRRSPMRVDFDQKSLSDAECVENPGQIINIDVDTITVEWGQCGREVVNYSVLFGELSAKGATIDSLGHRSNKRTWTLSHQ